MPDRFDPNELFTNSPIDAYPPPWEPFWDCGSFASTECDGDCDRCEAQTLEEI